MERSFYFIIILAILISAAMEILYQLTYLTYKTEESLIINLIIEDTVFAILGFLASIVSFSLYDIFVKEKEISTINFLLAPEKLKEELKFLFYLFTVGLIGWSFYTIAFSVICNFPELHERYERFFSVLGTSYFFSSVLFAMGVIFVLYRWRRRILLHG
jgi:hypothetical protein